MTNIKPPAGKKQNSLRARIALSTALATIAFGYAGRGAYAGVCSGSVGVYSCTGAANSVTDVTQTINIGTPFTVTTAGFGIDTSVNGGNGLYFKATGAMSFTDNNSSAITGAAIGLFGRNNGSGGLAITTTGAVTGNAGHGLQAIAQGGGGTASLTVTTTGGTVTGIGTLSDGIRAYNNPSSAGGVSITTGAVSGGRRGIFAVNSGAGALSVTSTGTVVGTANDGIYAKNALSSTTLTVSSSLVSGGTDGIDIRNPGSGASSVTVSGVVTGGSGDGIHTETGAGTTTITLNSGADVSASSGSAITNDSGNAAVVANAGSTVTGSISMGAGSDSVSFNGGDFTSVTSIDGGTGTDSLSFTSVTGTVAGGTVLNMENFTVGSGGNISLSGTLNTDTVTLNSGGTLGGSAIINADVTVNGGTLGAGNSPGLLEIVGNLDLGVSSTTLVELGGVVAETQYDVIDVSDDVGTGGAEGIVTLADGATFDVNFVLSFVANLGDSFDILVADDIIGLASTLNFDFSGATLGSGLVWDAEIVTSGAREALRLTVLESAADEIPEPSALVLFGTILLGRFGFWRRRQKAA
jgi:hypothetical protein